MDIFFFIIYVPRMRRSYVVRVFSCNVVLIILLKDRNKKKMNLGL